MFSPILLSAAQPSLLVSTQLTVFLGTYPFIRPPFHRLATRTRSEDSPFLFDRWPITARVAGHVNIAWHYCSFPHEVPKKKRH